MKKRGIMCLITVSALTLSTVAVGDYRNIATRGNIVDPDYIVIKGTVEPAPVEQIIECENAPVEMTTAFELECWTPDENDVIAIAKTLWGECRGVKSTAEKAAVVWCILNRTESGRGEFKNTIIGNITKPGAFDGWNPNNPVWPELYDLVIDVMQRKHREDVTGENCGRVLPKDWYYFTGKNGHNNFTKEWQDGNYWTWELENPYEN